MYLASPAENASSADQSSDKESPEEGSSQSRGKRKESKRRRIQLKMPSSMKQDSAVDHDIYTQILHPRFSRFRKSIDKMVVMTQEKIATQSHEMQHRKIVLSDTMRKKLQKTPIQHLQRKLHPKNSARIHVRLGTDDSGIPEELLEDETLSYPFENLMLVVMDDDDDAEPHKD